MVKSGVQNGTGSTFWGVFGVVLVFSDFLSI